MAIVFFNAPPISTPTTSPLPYSLSVFERKCAWIDSTAADDSPAATMAVGNSRASSMAKLGPESTTMAAAGHSTRSNSDIRSIEPSSRPLAALISVRPGAIRGLAARATARMPCDGTAITTNSAPARA